jgi:5-methylthioadenosine/S-adenosylhomocysteine deaminase
MMHAAESVSEDLLMREGRGPFAERLANRGIQWQTPGTSTVQYLAKHGVLGTSPLLAHCINVDEEDIATIKQSGASVAHCPKSNAKLGHGRAPFSKFLEGGVKLGFGSDSVASNNTCDILEEARFATLFARAEVCGGSTDSEGIRRPDSGVGQRIPDAHDALRTATSGGANALGFAQRVGDLSMGGEADFIAVSLSGAQQVPAYDATSALVFASSGRDVVLTVVAGREVFREGRVLAVDEERLRARMNEIAKKLGT